MKAGKVLEVKSEGWRHLRSGCGKLLTMFQCTLRGTYGEELVIFVDVRSFYAISCSVGWKIGHTVRLPYGNVIEGSYFLAFLDDLQQLLDCNAPTATLSPDDRRWMIKLERIQSGAISCVCNFEVQHEMARSSSFAIRCSLYFLTADDHVQQLRDEIRDLSKMISK